MLCLRSSGTIVKFTEVGYPVLSNGTIDQVYRGGLLVVEQWHYIDQVYRPPSHF